MNKKMVMIVDDNADLLSMIKKMFEKMTEHKVICVESGKKCFEILKRGEIPDLILLDIMMPEMTGWDVLAKLKNEKMWEQIPVIFLSAKDDDASVGLGTLTSEGYITKPFDISHLQQIVDKYL